MRKIIVYGIVFFILIGVVIGLNTLMLHTMIFEEGETYLEYFENVTQTNHSNTKDNLVAEYYFTNNSLEDSSGYGNDGTNAGTSISSGKIGLGRYFNGTDYISLGSRKYNLTKNFSISFWAKRDKTDITLSVIGLSTISSKSNLIFTATNKINFESDASAVQCQSTATNDTGWHHYTITTKDNVCKMYEDGINLTMLDSTVNNNLTINQIGRRGTTDHFNGTIDEVLFYNRTLNASEISEYYNLTKTNYLLYPDKNWTATDGGWEVLSQSSGDYRSKFLAFQVNDSESYVYYNQRNFSNTTFVFATKRNHTNDTGFRAYIRGNYSVRVMNYSNGYFSCQEDNVEKDSGTIDTNFYEWYYIKMVMNQSTFYGYWRNETNGEWTDFCNFTDTTYKNGRVMFKASKPTHFDKIGIWENPLTYKYNSTINLSANALVNNDTGILQYNITWYCDGSDHYAEKIKYLMENKSSVLDRTNACYTRSRYVNVSMNLTTNDGAGNVWTMVMNFTPRIQLISLSNLTVIIYDEEKNSQLSDRATIIKLLGSTTNQNHSFTTTYTIYDLPIEEYEIRYKADSYDERQYWITPSAYGNNTVTLYLLNSTLSTQILVTTYDETGDEMNDILLKLKRYFPDESEWKIVEEGKSNYEGETDLFVILNTEPYGIDFEKSGSLIYSISNTPLYSDSVIVKINTEEDILESYRKIGNMYYNLSFNNETRVVSLAWTDSDNIVREMCLFAIHRTPYTDRYYCANCTTGTGSTLECTLPDINGTIFAWGEVDSSTNFSVNVLDQMEITLGKEFLETFGEEGLFLLTFFIGAVAFIGAFSAVVFPFTLGAALIFASLFGMVSITYTTIIIVFVIGGIIVYLHRR